MLTQLPSSVVDDLHKATSQPNLYTATACTYTFKFDF
jgi:hypothetical protein